MIELLTLAIALAASDGEGPKGSIDKGEVVCGFVYENKRFYRLYSDDKLKEIYGVVKCPSEAQPTEQEIARLKNALPYKR